jgi:hypothetical protein
VRTQFGTWHFPSGSSCDVFLGPPGRLRALDVGGPVEALPADVRAMAEELLTAGYRDLARRHHPDHGGGQCGHAARQRRDRVAAACRPWGVERMTARDLANGYADRVGA